MKEGIRKLIASNNEVDIKIGLSILYKELGEEGLLELFRREGKKLNKDNIVIYTHNYSIFPVKGGYDFSVDGRYKAYWMGTYKIDLR